MGATDISRQRVGEPHCTERPAPAEAVIVDVAEQTGFAEYGTMLRRHWARWFLASFLGGVLGYLATLPQTPAYQARASMELQNLNENFLDLKDVNPTAAQGPTVSPEYDIQTQLKILQSDFLYGRVIARLQREKRLAQLISTRRVSRWRTLVGLPLPPEEPTQDELISMIAHSFSARNQVNTRVVEVFYDSTDAAVAAEVVNAAVAEFVEQDLDGRWRATQHTGAWLTRQLQDLKAKLEASEEQLRRYAQSSKLLFTSEKDNVAEDQIRRLHEELSKAQADRVAKQSKYELALRTSPESLPDVLDDPTLRSDQLKITDLKRERAELTATLTPANPRVVKVQAQITALEAALDRERGNVTQRIRNEYEAARRREELLQIRIEEDTRTFTGQSGKVSHYNMLRRDVETTRQLYEAMLHRVEEAGIASALRASNIRIIDTASPPRFPYKPNLPTNVVLGVLTGTAVGAMLIVLRERADRTIRKPGDTGTYLKVAELGVVPSVERPWAIRCLARHEGPLRLGIADANKLDPSLEPDPESADPGATPLSDAFRASLISILYSGQNGQRPRVVVVSSANPVEGKTTVALNLAITMAKANLRVVLIDADLRRPRVHKAFGLDGGKGLSDVLRSKVPPPVQPTGIPNLYVLASGSDPDPDLLYQEGITGLIRQLRAEFDMVLIDTPPMLQMPDARVIARDADGIILVVRSQKTTREAALLACRRLFDDGAPLLGVILNDWNPRTGTEAYSDYYKRYRHYYNRRSDS